MNIDLVFADLSVARFRQSMIRDRKNKVEFLTGWVVVTDEHAVVHAYPSHEVKSVTATPVW